MNRLLPVAGAIALAFATQGTAIAQTHELSWAGVRPAAA